ncbi:hypothetical protein R80B4_01031 [Fibrobacteres bacterium R8-0-B4]
MQIRGGGGKSGKSRSSSGHKRCDFLRIADDKSLLLKDPVQICKFYKLEYLQDPSGRVQTRCQWADTEENAIFCTNLNN